MSLELAKAWVRVGVDNTALGAGLNQARGQVMGALHAIAPLAGSLLAGLGLNNLMSDAHAMIGEAQERDKAEKRLEAAWLATKNAIGMTIEELHEMAGAWSMATEFDKTSIIDSMSSMLTYTALTRKEMELVMETGMDITAMFGGDLKNNMQQVAMILSNPLDKNFSLGQLKRKGYPGATAEQEARMKAARKAGDAEAAKDVIMELLSGQEGAAKHMAGGADSELKRMKKQLQEVRIAIGKELVQVYNKWEEATLGLQVAKIQLIRTLGYLVGNLLELNKHLGGLPLIMGAGAAAAFGLMFAISGLQKTFQMLTNTLLFSGWGTLIVVIGALAGAIMWWVTQTESGRAAWESLTAAVRPIMSLLYEIGGNLLRMVGDMFSWLGGVASQALGGVHLSFKGVTDAITMVLDYLSLFTTSYELTWKAFTATTQIAVLRVGQYIHGLFGNDITGWVLGGMKAAYSIVKNHIDMIYNTFMFLANGIATIFSSIWEGIKEGWNKGSITAGLKKMGSEFKQGLESAEYRDVDYAGDAINAFNEGVEQMSGGEASWDPLIDSANEQLTSAMNEMAELRAERRRIAEEEAAKRKEGLPNLPPGAPSGPGSGAAGDGKEKEPKVERQGIVDFGKSIQDALAGNKAHDLQVRQLDALEQGNDVQQQVLEAIKGISLDAALGLG
jgi:hypothetical protein